MRSALILAPAALAVLSATQVLRSLLKPVNHRAQRTETAWSQLVAAIANPDLPAAVALCLIGVLLALNLIFASPTSAR